MSYLTHGRRRRRRETLEGVAIFVGVAAVLLVLWALIVYLAALAWGLA